VGKLTLLPAGEPPPNPTELLSSEKMGQLIEELKGRYQDRHIIFDTTPAGLGAETNFLAAMTDGILLVVRSGKTSMPTLMEAIGHLNRDKILGVVFNASEEAQRKYQYYYRYYQGGRKK
jgi:Mrp family chromosome partitioning ATPase